MIHTLACVLAAALLPLSSGCDKPASREGASLVTYEGEYPYKIVTTCGMVTDIVAIVAGEHAVVSGLMGPSVDPHLYKPTRNDVKQLLEADVVFYVGLLLEGKMAESFEQVERRGKPVYAVTASLPESELRSPPEFEGHYDPHVWMDVSLWSDAVGEVAKRLAAFDPKHAESYRNNAQEYQARLGELDAYVRKVLATIPERQRVLVTSHDAFGYFAEAYGMRVLAPQGITTDSEAGVNDINQLVDEIVQEEIKAIFIESSVNPANIEAIIAGAAQQGWEVRIGGELYSDAMGPPGTYTGTYIGMMDHNATVISRALGGDAPAGGFQGKLEDTEE